MVQLKHCWSYNRRLRRSRVFIPKLTLSHKYRRGSAKAGLRNILSFAFYQLAQQELKVRIGKCTICTSQHLSMVYLLISCLTFLFCPTLKVKMMRQGKSDDIIYLQPMFAGILFNLRSLYYFLQLQARKSTCNNVLVRNFCEKAHLL